MELLQHVLMEGNRGVMGTRVQNLRRGVFDHLLHKIYFSLTLLTDHFVEPKIGIKIITFLAPDYSDFIRYWDFGVVLLIRIRLWRRVLDLRTGSLRGPYHVLLPKITNRITIWLSPNSPRLQSLYIPVLIKSRRTQNYIGFRPGQFSGLIYHTCLPIQHYYIRGRWCEFRQFLHRRRLARLDHDGVEGDRLSLHGCRYLHRRSHRCDVIL